MSDIEEDDAHVVPCLSSDDGLGLHHLAEMFRFQFFFLILQII